MIHNPVTIRLTKQQRDERLRRKATQLYYGKLLALAYDAGVLAEMLNLLKLKGASDGEDNIIIQTRL